VASNRPSWDIDCRALRPDFTLIDASIGCEARSDVLPGLVGPTVDDGAPRGMALCSRSDDLVAVPTPRRRGYRHDPGWRCGTSRLAYDRGLGQMRQELII